MATTTQFVAVTAVNQQLSKPPPAGTLTSTFVVPANSEANIKVQCICSTSGASTVATFTLASPAITILNNTSTTSLQLETTVVLGPGTYTLTATSPGGVSTATVNLIGTLKTYT
jgi:hypothetical protein